MMNISRLLLNRKLNLKKDQITQSNKGFTMVELLVSTIVAFLIITPLLTFVMNILETERKEQAKTVTDQGIQAAIDYIGRDLSQAVYIYDADGLKKTGIEDQLPYLNDRRNKAPVLVFWKRDYVRQVIPFDRNESDPARFCTQKPTQCDDGYRYSLVAYYIVNGSAGKSVWSNTARIERFELKDAVRYFNGESVDLNNDKTEADRYFSSFVIEGDIKKSMNKWTTDPSGALNTAAGVNSLDIQVLVDYIDDTPLNKTTPTTNLNCRDILGPDATRVPQEAIDQNAPSGFYGCIDSGRTLAKIFIRGNALANSSKDAPDYDPKLNSYFPTASIQVQGRGFLGTSE